MIAGVYAITDRIDGRRYVGSASSIAARWLHHKGRLRAGRHVNAKLQAAWREHGETAFIFQVVELMERTNLFARENFWITRLAAFGPSGLNLAPRAGTHVGIKRSAETRERLSVALKGNRNGLGNKAATGRKWTPEKRAHMVAFMRGNRFSAGSKNHCMPHSAEARAKMSATKRAKKLARLAAA